VFLQLPFQAAANLQRTVLTLNTVILIAALIVVELVYAEAPKEKRAHLKHFYPLFVVLVGLLIYAIYKQVRSS
jgi:uncharacterized membrane protein